MLFAFRARNEALFHLNLHGDGKFIVFDQIKGLPEAYKTRFGTQRIATHLALLNDGSVTGGVD